MNKRGFVFIPLLTILSLFIFGYALLLFATEAREKSTKTLGALQVDSLNLIWDSEYKLLNLDNVARYAGFRALGSLGEVGVENGGVWDENPKQRLLILFEKIYDEKFKSYLQKTDFKDISYTYFFNISNKLIIEGYAKSDFVSVSGLAEYTIKPSFRVVLDYDLGIYDRLYEKYSSWGKEKKCVKQEDILEGFSVSCTEDKDFLNFKVITKNLGYVQPVILFKIRKSGELFGNS